MPVKTKIQNTAFNIPPYIFMYQVFTPPLNYLRTFCINYFYNLLYVFYLQHTSVCSFCNSYLRNNINNSYKYLPCCSNKYIFIICKNKFEKHNHPVFCSLIWVGFKKQENSFIKLLK